MRNALLDVVAAGRSDPGDPGNRRWHSGVIRAVELGNGMPTGDARTLRMRLHAVDSVSSAPA